MTANAGWLVTLIRRICTYPNHSIAHTMAFMRRNLLSIAAGVIMFSLVSGGALAAPATMQLSSWAPKTQAGTIVGGTQTVTLSSVSTVAVDVAFDIAPAPCDCTIATWEASAGDLQGSLWTIDQLAVGETVTLTIEYIDSNAVLAGTTSQSAPVIGRLASVLAIGLVFAGLVLSRPSRYRIFT